MDLNPPPPQDKPLPSQDSKGAIQTDRSGSEAWQGAVDLHYDYAEAKTRLAKVWHQAPLKVQRPFYPEAKQVCHTILIHTAGGMVGGDRLLYRLTLDPQAHAVITSAAASKVYGTQNNLTEQMIEINLAENAYLEWLPQETILFNQAQFKQTLKVNLAPHAGWLGWDIYRFGRTARGERFVEGVWRSQTEVWRAGIPLWIDRQWLPASPQMIDHPHGLNQCPVVGTFAWIGKEVDRAFVQHLRECWTQLGLSGEVGVTRVQQGVVCRYRGQSTAEARQWFTQVWNHVRFYALGQPACPMRIWQV
jgi:urease accessory protein